MQSLEELRDLLAELQTEKRRLKARAEEADLLLAAMRELFSMGVSDDPFAVVFRALGTTLPFERCLALVDRDGRLVCEAASDATLVGHVLDIVGPKRKALRGKAVSALPQPGSGIDPEGRFAALYLPLAAATAQGVLVVMRDARSGLYSTADLALGTRFAVVANQALSLRAQVRAETRNRHLAELSATLERQAHYDHLTGLPNRIKIDMILEDRIARGPDRPFALAFVDVNKFKQINDYYGHEIGDRLLVSIAERILAQTRPGDVLARISGDEFLLVLDDITRREMADMVLDRVAEVVNGPCRLGEFTVHSSVSVGVARYPDHSLTQAELRRHADSAMYRAKTVPGGAVVHFDESMAQDVTAKMELETRLRRAIEHCRFTPVFQPQVDMRAGRVTGFEVLLRWQDEDGALKAPGAFLGVAEELGLINRMIEIAAAKVSDALPALSARFGAATTVSLNIAAGQATNTDFLGRLVEIIRPARSPGRFVFEITEDQALDVESFARHVRPMLDDHGILVAIDDFGKGYSSLSALSRLDAHEVKVDREFVSDIHRDPARQRVLRMIEYYARASRTRCVVEGVETAEELAYLRAQTGLSIVQGYYFARPMDVTEVLAWRLADDAVAATAASRAG